MKRKIESKMFYCKYIYIAIIYCKIHTFSINFLLITHTFQKVTNYFKDIIRKLTGTIYAFGTLNLN